MFFCFPSSGLWTSDPGLPQGVLLLICSVFLLSCSGSSPRFRTDDVSAVEEEQRFASKIKEEEQREDDRKVDLSTFRQHASLSGGQAPPWIDRDAVLLDVVSFLGVPYRYGGNSKQGIDCSGFTSTIYRNSMSVSLPRTAREQFRAGSRVDDGSLLFGDLVFFNTTGSGASHVGIYLEDDLFAHASVSYGVTISSLESTYYRKRFLGAKRVAPE